MINKMLFVLFLLPLALAGQVSKTEWEKISKPNYSISYPQSWELSQNPKKGIEFILFTSLESEKDKFKENINLVIQDLTGRDLGLKAYSEISEAQIKNYLINAQILENKLIKKEVEYQKIIYAGKLGDFQLKFEQYYFVIDKMAYILTFTSEETNFEKYKEEAEKILNTFIVIKKTNYS